MNQMIRQATLQDCVVIESIFLDVIDWMTQKHISNLWTKQNMSWHALSQHYSIEDFYVYCINNKPVGCLALTDEDKVYWPDIPAGKSLYIHKLAVKREFSGRGISKKLIDYSKNLAHTRGISAIRLDCNMSRGKLCELYESQGFQYFKKITTNTGYTLALYEYFLEEV